MKFIAYHSPEAPAHEAWLVSLYEPSKGGLRRLPIFFAASTKETALASAEKWWRDEQERQQKRAGRAAARRKGAQND